MPTTMQERLKNEAKAFTIAPVYPFVQRDWVLKMWLFVALSYVPVINLIVARGWRKDYIYRIGWRCNAVLPSPLDTLRFLKDGIKLWVATAIYLMIPLLIISIIGIGGIVDLWNDIVYVATLLFDYVWRRSVETSAFLEQLWSFTKTELLHTIYVVLIENVYLIIYIPMYRVAMIRFSITDRLIASHLSIIKNLRFLFVNLIEILLMYAFNVFNFVLIIVIDFLLAASVVGSPLIPVVTFYMFFWNTGYEYGLLAQTMIEQEGLEYETDSRLQRPHLMVT